MILCPTRSKELRLTGDTRLVGDIIGKDIIIDSGALILDCERKRLLRDVSITRIGSSGPAIIVRADGDKQEIRFSWDNVCVFESNGDGIIFEGTFLGSINHLWIEKCQGDGIIFRNNTTTANPNNAGANALSIHGGEIQACNVGIRARDTKGVSFTGYTVEGCNDFGILLEDDNRNFSFDKGYFENNKRNAVGGPSDILVLGNGIPNRAICFNCNYFSDGGINHARAIEVVQNVGNDVHTSTNHYWAYADTQPSNAQSDGTNSAESPVNPFINF